MRIGDQIQISGKKITPLKSKSTSVSVGKKIDHAGQLNASPKGQIIASKTQDKVTYFLLRSEGQSSPKWESKDKLILTHKNIIDKYERQQKAFVASQQQPAIRPQIVISASDDSDDDKNKLNGKRKLCIGGKAPVINGSGKKVCTEAAKDGQPQISAALQSSKLRDGNILQFTEKQTKNNQNVASLVGIQQIKAAAANTAISDATISSVFNAIQQKITPNEKKNNLFDTLNYYNIAEESNQNKKSDVTKNNFSNINHGSKISHKLLFDSQPVHQLINPKNIAKTLEKQVQKEIQVLQQAPIAPQPIAQENSKNFSDIENISYLNNSVSEEQKSDYPNKKQMNNQVNRIKSNNISTTNKQNLFEVTKSSSAGNIFFKRDDLVKKPEQTSESPSKLQTSASKKGLGKLITYNSSPSKLQNNNTPSIQSSNLTNNLTNNQKKKSSSFDEGIKSKINTTSEKDQKTSQLKLNSSAPQISVEKKNSSDNNNKKVIAPSIVEEEDDFSQDNIVLKKKDFGSYMMEVFKFTKQTPKNSFIKNVYSPSKSPMIDQNKNKIVQSQSQVQDSQIEGPPKDGPLNQILQQNLARLNQIITNSEKKKLNRSANSSDLNDDLNGMDQELIEDTTYLKDISQIDHEENLKEYEKEKADYSQFQNQQIQEFIVNHDTMHNEELNDEDSDMDGYVLQLEKGSNKIQQQIRDLRGSPNKFNYNGLQIEKQDKILKVTLPQSSTNVNEQSLVHKELQSTFESTQQEESKQGEQKKTTSPIYLDKNILPASLESNFSSRENESAIMLNQESQRQTALPDSGNFSCGDKAKRINACRPKDNDIMMEIEWETRPDGKVPEKSTISSRLVREYDHDLLIDFYESKIKFTYKNAAEKKKQTQSLNASVKKEYNSPNQIQ